MDSATKTGSGDSYVTAEARSARALGDAHPKFAYVDCLRGYAVLMVIICHTTYAIPNLPYRAHQLGAFGWHGVQLFFLASCITLLMSADHERARKGSVNAGDFFLRRFLRIAPMYYLAALFYWLLFPDPHARLSQLLASFAFVNAWHPVTTTTTGDWQVVPGGWSIGVEFTFYFLFPFFAAAVTSIRRALGIFLGAIVLGAALNSFAMAPLTARFGFAAADNFLYFWFFNQAPIFALGAIAYFLVRAVEMRPESGWAHTVKRRGFSFFAASIVLTLAVALAPVPFTHQLLVAPMPPQFLAAAGAFVLFIIAMSQTRSRFWVNSVIGWIGKVSFSAYLLHFAVIDLVLNRHAAFFHLNAMGWTALAVFAGAILVVTAVTILLSSLTYTAIEKPMMQVAKKLTRRPVQAAAALS